MIRFSFISNYLAAHCFDEPDKPKDYYVKAILGEHHTQVEGDGEQYIDVEKVIVVIKIIISNYNLFKFHFLKSDGGNTNYLLTNITCCISFRR
jgi:hypothetical protein